MNFEYNHYYEIYNSGSGKYVNLSGDHEDGIVNNGEKVTMYARTNNPDQRWALERYGSDYQVRIVLQRGDGWYALNYNTSTAGCIVWHLNSAADSDTVITLEPVVSFWWFVPAEAACIQCISHRRGFRTEMASVHG